MKRSSLLRHLRKYGCYLKRKVGSIRCGSTQRREQSKRYHATQKYHQLAKKICRNLSVPER